MAKNGIAINIPASLGLSQAGLIWLPLPEGGLEASWLEETSRFGAKLSRALCREEDLRDRNVSPIDVDRPDWSGVERWVAISVARREKAAAEKAAERAAAEAATPIVDAAIANPGSSELLIQSEPTNVRPWGEWDWSRGSVLASTDVAWDGLCERLRVEARRRNAEARQQWADRIALLNDDELRAFTKGAVYHGGTRDHLSRETLARIDAAAKRDSEAEQTAIELQLRAALSAAPAHVLERFEAGFLPADELERYLSDAAFGSISLPLYQDLTDDDYEHSDECDGGKIKINGRAYNQDDDTLDAEEWSSWTVAREACSAAGLEAQLRVSRVYCTEEDCDNAVYRLSARVTATIGGITVKRDYAVG